MITKDEAKKLNRERLDDAATEKAEQYKAQMESEAQEGWTKFILEHSGTRAVERGSVYMACEANHQIMTEALEARNLHVDPAGMNLSAIFNDPKVQSRLAKYNPGPYQRRTSPRTFLPQVEKPSLPAKLPPFSRSEYLKMSTAEMHLAIKRYGAEALNKLLAGI